MPKARKTQVSLKDIPYYHCVSRCVRRAFLCGKDTVTGQDYEHRRQWVEDRLLLLAGIYALDVCAYAVMSNHTHAILYIDSEMAKSWTTQEVLERWHKLHKGTLLTQAYVRLQKVRYPFLFRWRHGRCRVNRCAIEGGHFGDGGRNDLQNFGG